jgi:hypothetical protein
MSVGFIKKKSVTIHGHTNVKYLANMVEPVYSCLSNLFEAIKFESVLYSVL